ncbi:MAG TPA: ABC transporter substrate-binding protein [Chloroflexia bacterium]|jgi:polar amino acid transport system substrate-binding protein
MYEILVKRAGVFAAMAALLLMLAACGGDPAQPAATTGAGSTPAAEATTGVDGGGGAVPAGSTPVSDWRPGKYANSVKPPEELAAAGTLTFGCDVAYPPQEYVDATGKAVGMDIDIAEEIATRMGLKLNVINFKFDNIIPALNAGQFDAVISAMTITDERSQVVNFVEYFEAGQSVLVKKGNPAGIKTLDDLSGKKVAAQSGTVAEETLTALNERFESEGKAKAEVLVYPVDTDAVDQLRIGRVEATLHDSPVAAYYSKLNPDFEIGVENFDSAPQGIAVAKDNQAMFDAITSAMDAMKSDGTLDAIKAKWGVD